MTLWAARENTPELARAMKTPARSMNTPIKTRTLKNADREADFFFISGYALNGKLECGAHLVTDLLRARQHFFEWCVNAPGFIRPRKFLQAFFKFFSDAPAIFRTRIQAEKRWDARSMRLASNNLVTFS